MLADTGWVHIIFLRWLHVVCACLLVGATFYAAFLAKPGELQGRESAGPLVPRGYKMLVHTCILLLLASGTYNAIANWQAYRQNMPLTHALFGPHVLLALVVVAILLVILAPREPRGRFMTWLCVAAVLLLLTVLMASALKYAREHPKAQQQISYMMG